MIDRPSTWATDANFDSPGKPWDGSPTKTEPGSGRKAEGFEPGYTIPADWLNWLDDNRRARLVKLMEHIEDSAAVFGQTATDSNTTALADAIKTQAFRAAFANWSSLAGTVGGLDSGALAANSVRLVRGFAGGAIYTSDDAGATWTARTSNTTKKINEIVWNGSLFVAVCDDGEIVTSPDGITWTARTSNATGTPDIDCVCWDSVASLWIAMGDIDPTYGYIGTSPDGVTWTKQTGHHTGTAVGFKRCASRAGRSIAISQGAATFVSWSSNATTWGAAVNPTGISTHQDVAFLNDTTAVLLGVGNLDARSATTTDGTNFTLGTELGTGEELTSVLSGGMLAGVMYVAGSGRVYASSDGLTWEVIGRHPPLLPQSPTGRGVYAFGRIYQQIAVADMLAMTHATGQHGA
jgi:hypothetical protein